MSTIYLPGFGNIKDKISAQLPKDTITIQETMREIQVKEKNINIIKDRTKNVLNKTEQIKEIEDLILQLQQAKIDQNEETKTKTISKLIEKRTLLIDKTTLRGTIQKNYPGTIISDIATKLTTIFTASHNKKHIIEKITQRFGAQTKTWTDSVQDTKEILFERLVNNKTTIYAHSQGGLLLGHIYQGLSEKEKTIWNKKIEKIVLVTPVSQPQEAKYFHILPDGLYRQTYLHPGRDLIVTQEFLDSIAGTELGESLQHIASKITIILGKDDPYLPGWNANRIQVYKNQGYTVETIEGDHYPLIIQ